MAGAVNELVMSNEEIAAELGTPDAPDVIDSDDAVSPDLDFEEEVENPWLDGDESDSEEDEAETEAAAPAKQAQSVREFKANGKTHTVDMADQKLVDQLLTLGLGARPVFTERDQLRKQVSTKDKQIAEMSKYRDLWTKLEAKKSDHDALYEQIFGRKFDEAASERKKWADDYAAASPAEQRLMDMQRDLEAKQRAESERLRQIDEREKAAAEKADAAERREFKAMMLPHWQKYCEDYSAKFKNEAQAAKFQQALWKLTVVNMKRHGDEWEPTPADIRQEFKETAELLLGGAEEVATAKVKQITADKKTQAKAQAKVASKRNYTASESSLVKEKDPVKLFRKMFR